jgi:surface antigen
MAAGRRCLKRRLQALAALLLFAGNAAAAGFGFLADTPLSRFNDDDMRRMNGAIEKALTAGDPRAVERWRNDQTGSSGEVSTQRAFENEGRPCRDLRVVNRHRNLENAGIYTLCRDGGSWRLVP